MNDRLYCHQDNDRLNTGLALEKYLLPRNIWFERAPAEVKAKAIDAEPDMNVMVGEHPRFGWFVLASQGQGPVIIHPEGEWPPLPACDHVWLAVSADEKRVLRQCRLCKELQEEIAKPWTGAVL